MPEPTPPFSVSIPGESPPERWERYNRLCAHVAELNERLARLESVILLRPIPEEREE